MPPPVKSAYAGGWSEATKRKLEQVTIPDKIKCVNCKKIRMQAMFSKRQLEYLRHGIVTQGISAINGPGIAKCRVCVGGQTVELKCCICDRIKGLDAFAKAQRQFHDTARCLNCVQSVTEADLVDEQKLLPENELTTQDSALTRSHLDDESLAGTAQRLNLNSPFPGSGLSGFEDDDDLSSVGGGVWVESDSANDENSISKGKGRMFTGYDSKGVDYSCLGGSQSGNADPFYASPPSGSGSAAAAAAAAATAAAATAELPNMTTGMTLPPPPLPKKKDSKFAKVPSRRVEKADAPSMRVPETTSKAIPSDDEDDEDNVESFL